MNIVTATFSSGCRQVAADEKLWQWDQGQILQIVGLDLPDAYQVEFSNQPSRGSAAPMIGSSDGVEIPDVYLTTGLPVYAFIVLHTGEDDRETEYRITIYVNARPQPTDVPPTPEQQAVIDQLIAALNAGVAKAEDAAAQAEAAISYMPKIEDGTWWVYDAEAETWADTGIQAEGQDGVGISEAVLNADYTLTLTFTDGSSYTTPSIRGAQGEPGPIGPTPDISIGTVTTGAAGSQAAATMTGTPERPVLNLTIPRGDPGEVTQAEFDELAGEVADQKSAISLVVNTLEETAVDGYSESNTSIAGTGTAPFVFDKSEFSYSDWVVSKVKLKGVTAGIVSLGTIKRADALQGEPVDRTLASIKATINISNGLQTVDVSNPFTVASDEYLFIGFPGDTGKWTYGSSGNDKHFLYVINGTGRWGGSGNSAGVTVYVEKAELSEDLQNTIDSTNEIKDFLGFGEDTTTTVYKSLAVNAGSGSNPSLSPFILNQLDYSNAPYSITGIRMNISQAGVLTVGRVLKSKVAVGNTFNIDDFSDSQTINITFTGVQDIPLTPVEITDDYYLFVNVPGDTAKFYYGGSGTGLDTVGFIYPANGEYITGGSYIGVNVVATVSGIPSSVRDIIDSVYSGKRLSILGDSISTFAGYIPAGNATYYPSGTVTTVSDTWWFKLYTALGMILDTNNSWSGSRVTTTAGDASAGCMTRCQELGSPDVIIVWMGINDFNNEVALGTYDGTTEIPSVTTTFREAYGIMLNKILTKYQTSEVWVCTLPQCERNGTSGFPEINGNNVALAQFNKAIRELADAFGVKVLEHNKCGLTYQNMPTYNPDNLHPNKYGHSLVANNDIRQMDGTINKRYPLS